MMELIYSCIALKREIHEYIIHNICGLGPRCGLMCKF